MTESGEQGTREAIMDAAFEAVSKHGYAEISVSDIVDEFEKSRSILYYHYDSKDEILVSLLEYALEEFMADLAGEPAGAARDELERLIETFLPTSLDDTQRRMQSVILELRAQAVTNDTFREQFTMADEQLHARIAGIVERGIDDGEFRPVDPERVGDYVLATLHGARSNAVTTSRERVAERSRESLFTYLDQQLCKPSPHE